MLHLHWTSNLLSFLTICCWLMEETQTCLFVFYILTTYYLIPGHIICRTINWRREGVAIDLRAIQYVWLKYCRDTPCPSSQALAATVSPASIDCVILDSSYHSNFFIVHPLSGLFYPRTMLLHMPGFFNFQGRKFCSFLTCIFHNQNAVACVLTKGHMIPCCLSVKTSYMDSSTSTLLK